MPRGDVRIELVPPIRGLRADMPRHLVPDGYLTDGSNALVRYGAVVVRPGVSAITTAPSANRVMGLIYYVDHTDVDQVVAGTSASLHLFNGIVWSNITGTALTGGNDNQVRFSVFQISNATRLIAVNDADVPQVYTGSGTFAALGGSPPIAKCITSAFQRVILGNVTVSGVRRGSSMWISGFQDSTSWSSTNEVTLSDTNDLIVEIKALNTQAFAVYKDRSQWIGIGTGNIFPFIFELRDQQPGPVSPASVVQAESSHYYLGQDGDIYRFDGNRCTSIGAAVKPVIQTDVDFVLANRAHGFYDPFYREIYWFWPTTQGPNQTSGIVYRLPYGDLPGAFSTLLSYAMILTASSQWRRLSTVSWNSLTGTWDDLGNTYPTWNIFGGAQTYSGILGDSTGQVSEYGLTGGDNGQAFSAQWDFPFRALTGVGENVRVDAIESMFRNAVAGTTANIILVTSNTMDTNGTAETAQSVNLNSGSRLRATYENVVGRFVSVRHTMTGLLGLQEYRGGTLFVYKRGED